MPSRADCKRPMILEILDWCNLCLFIHICLKLTSVYSAMYEIRYILVALFWAKKAQKVQIDGLQLSIFVGVHVGWTSSTKEWYPTFMLRCSARPDGKNLICFICKTAWTSIVSDQYEIWPWYSLLLWDRINQLVTFRCFLFLYSSSVQVVTAYCFPFGCIQFKKQYGLQAVWFILAVTKLLTQNLVGGMCFLLGFPLKGPLHLFKGLLRKIAVWFPSGEGEKIQHGWPKTCQTWKNGPVNLCMISTKNNNSLPDINIGSCKPEFVQMNASTNCGMSHCYFRSAERNIIISVLLPSNAQKRCRQTKSTSLSEESNFWCDQFSNINNNDNPAPATRS